MVKTLSCYGQPWKTKYVRTSNLTYASTLFAKKEGETESSLHKTVKTQMQEEYDEQQWRWSEGLMLPVMSSLW